MAVHVGIIGMGRIGGPALRAVWNREDLEVVHLSKIAGVGTSPAICRVRKPVAEPEQGG